MHVPLALVEVAAGYQVLRWLLAPAEEAQHRWFSWVCKETHHKQTTRVPHIGEHHFV
jgi:hypothetical protein